MQGAAPHSIALLANPDSGSGEAGSVEDALRAEGAEVRRFPPERAGEAVRCGAGRLVVAGGDGSVAPAAAEAAAAGMPLAVIPVGTANDFAAAAGLPSDPGEAARLAARGERRRPIDLAWLGERPFVNVASAGLSPKAARNAAGLKGALGSLAYRVGALRAAARARPVRCGLACDGEEVFDGGAWQVTVGCSGAFGAGSSVGGELDDGLLQAVALPAGRRASLLRHAYGLRRGRIAEQSGVAARAGTRVELDLDPGTDLNVDGELVRSGAVTITVEPRAFELLIG